jgi:hypothetical protein
LPWRGWPAWNRSQIPSPFASTKLGPTDAGAAGAGAGCAEATAATAMSSPALMMRMRFMGDLLVLPSPGQAAGQMAALCHHHQTTAIQGVSHGAGGLTPARLDGIVETRPVRRT